MTSEHMQNIPSYKTLRRRAEEILQRTDRNTKIGPTDQDLLDLVNEVEVHQVELDLQNKELRRAYDALEEKMRARTAELQGKTEELETLNQQLLQEVHKRKKFEAQLNEFGEKLTKAYEQRDYLSRRLVDLLERERREMGDALHDQIGQILTGVSIQLDNLKNLRTEDGAPLKDRIEPIRDRVNETIGQTREISHFLRTEILEKFGLIDALKSLVSRMERESGMHIRLSTKGIPEDRLREKGIDFTLYRSAQEGLTNVAKHAEAEEVFVHLAHRDGKISLTIEDDGKGFDPEALFTGKDPYQGPLGLTIMKERVSLVGGDLDIDSAPGRGTCIVAEIPV
ncbi:MAG: ATP-binding protein [Desulfobacteraceae bacterium]